MEEKHLKWWWCGGVGGFGEGIKKMRRSQITEFRVSKSYNQYNIC